MTTGGNPPCIRPFRRTDPKTGKSTFYEIGDPYDGPVDKDYLDPQGPDGQGPLIDDTSPSTASNSGVKTSSVSDSSGKGSSSASDSSNKETK